MEITESSLWREVEAILSGGEKPVHLAWNLTILANGEEIAPLKVLSIDFNQDYLNNYADFIMVTMMLPLGTYAKRVYPFLDNLDIELSRENVGEVSDAVDEDAIPQVERYTATMIDTGNPIIEASVGRINSEEDLNRIDILEVKFQLTNKSLEQLRMIPVGAIYRNMTGEDVVKAVLTKASRTTTVSEERKVQGVDMVPASNQEVRPMIQLPQNLQLVDVPFHVHHHCGGLYSAGLGYYLQNDHWYVFPCYDNTRFNDGDPTLTIINVPENILPGVERTYRKDGDNLVIIATGKTSFRDLSNLLQLNEGNGVRFADASKMMDNFVTTKGNKAIASRKLANTEIITAKRKNNMNYVTTALRSINANPFVEYSALAARQGSGVNVVWENANRSLLHPGMPTKFVYLDGEDIKELYGVLQGVHEYASLREAGATSTRYTSSLTLSVFVKTLDSVEDTA